MCPKCANTEWMYFNLENLKSSWNFEKSGNFDLSQGIFISKLILCICTDILLCRSGLSVFKKKKFHQEYHVFFLDFS